MRELILDRIMSYWVDHHKFLRSDLYKESVDKPKAFRAYMETYSDEDLLDDYLDLRDSYLQSWP